MDMIPTGSGFNQGVRSRGHATNVPKPNASNEKRIDLFYMISECIVHTQFDEI
jgi:hypothetical protein